MTIILNIYLIKKFLYVTLSFVYKLLAHLHVVGLLTVATYLYTQIAKIYISSVIIFLPNYKAEY